MKFYPALLFPIVFSMSMVACDSVTSDPVSVDSILDSCGGSEFSGPSLYTGTVATSVFQCIINKLDENDERAQEIYGKLLVNAIDSSNLEAVTLLMNTNMDVNTVDLFGTPFLRHALGRIERGSETYDNAVSIARLLVASGARITDDEHGDYTTDWFASTIEAVQIMIDAGMNVNTRRPLDESWRPVTALVGAVEQACRADDEERKAIATETVKVLVKAGADVNTMSIGQIVGEGDGGLVIVGLFEVESVLDIAEDGNCPEIVQILKEAGACEDLERRRWEWGIGRGLDFIIRFLQEIGGLYEPRELDCSR